MSKTLPGVHEHAVRSTYRARSSSGNDSHVSSADKAFHTTREPNLSPHDYSAQSHTKMDRFSSSASDTRIRYLERLPQVDFSLGPAQDRALPFYNGMADPHLMAFWARQSVLADDRARRRHTLRCQREKEEQRIAYSRRRFLERRRQEMASLKHAPKISTAPSPATSSPKTKSTAMPHSNSNDNNHRSNSNSNTNNKPHRASQRVQRNRLAPSESGHNNGNTTTATQRFPREKSVRRKAHTQRRASKPEQQQQQLQQSSSIPCPHPSATSNPKVQRRTQTTERQKRRKLMSARERIIDLDAQAAMVRASAMCEHEEEKPKESQPVALYGLQKMVQLQQPHEPSQPQLNDDLHERNEEMEKSEDDGGHESESLHEKQAIVPEDDTDENEAGAESKADTAVTSWLLAPKGEADAVAHQENYITKNHDVSTDEVQQESIEHLRSPAAVAAVEDAPSAPVVSSLAQSVSLHEESDHSGSDYSEDEFEQEEEEMQRQENDTDVCAISEQAKVDALETITPASAAAAVSATNSEVRASGAGAENATPTKLSPMHPSEHDSLVEQQQQQSHESLVDHETRSRSGSAVASSRSLHRKSVTENEADSVQQKHAEINNLEDDTTSVSQHLGQIGSEAASEKGAAVVNVAVADDTRHDDEYSEDEFNDDEDAPEGNTNDVAPENLPERSSRHSSVSRQSDAGATPRSDAIEAVNKHNLDDDDDEYSEDEFNDDEDAPEGNTNDVAPENLPERSSRHSSVSRQSDAGATPRSDAIEAVNKHNLDDDDDEYSEDEFDDDEDAPEGNTNDVAPENLPERSSRHSSVSRQSDAGATPRSDAIEAVNKHNLDDDDDEYSEDEFNDDEQTVETDRTVVTAPHAAAVSVEMSAAGHGSSDRQRISSRVSSVTSQALSSHPSHREGCHSRRSMSSDRSGSVVESDAHVDEAEEDAAARALADAHNPNVSQDAHLLTQQRMRRSASTISSESGAADSYTGDEDSINDESIGTDTAFVVRHVNARYETHTHTDSSITSSARSTSKSGSEV